MSSANEHWLTPAKLLDAVRKVGVIALDPCSHPHSSVGALESYTLPVNGLEQSWADHKDKGLAFVNPPYGRKLLKWVVKSVIEQGRGLEVILLIPARTDTKAFHKWIFPTFKALCFVEGRLTFTDGRDPDAKQLGATFPSAVIYWGPNVDKFVDAFSSIGYVVRNDRSLLFHLKGGAE